MKKKKKKIFALTARSVARELIPFVGRFKPARVNPIKLVTASAFNRLGQYASSPGNRTYCYAELAVSSLAVAETIASTH